MSACARGAGFGARILTFVMSLGGYPRRRSATGCSALEGPTPLRLRRRLPRPGAHAAPRGDSRPPHNVHSQPSSDNPLVHNPPAATLRNGFSEGCLRVQKPFLFFDKSNSHLHTRSRGEPRPGCCCGCCCYCYYCCCCYCCYCNRRCCDDNARPATLLSSAGVSGRRGAAPLALVAAPAPAEPDCGQAWRQRLYKQGSL